jgi:trimethylamine--corrinoid protein Co-methyltransferase
MLFEPLTAAESAAIHETALRILEEVGFLVPPGGRAAARLRDLGLVARADGRMLLPRDAVEAALRRAPRVVRLGARAAGRTAVLDGTRTWVTTDGCGARALDPGGGGPRPSILADVERSARLTDALDRFDVYWTMVSAQDVPVGARVATEYLAAVRNTVKHVQMVDVARAEEAVALTRMAAAVRETGLAADPPVSILISVVSPLRLDPGGLEAALVFAAAGLPVAACSMPIASVTAPATPAGVVCLAHAEVVGFAAILEMLAPGAPILYCSFPAFADARTGVTNYSEPRRFWAAAAATVLGRSAGLPAFTSGELGSLLARADLLCFGGLLEVSTLLSLEQLVIDHEQLRDWTIAAAAPAVDDETLALQVVRDVGPAGHYLSHRHTVRHIREYVVPAFAAAAQPTGPAGAPPAGRAAAAREALRLLETHRPEPLPADLDAALERLAREPVAAA